MIEERSLFMKKLVSFFVSLFVSVGCLFTIASCAKVNFVINFIVDEEVYYSLNTNGNEVIQMPENPTKEGMDFDGWYWDKDYWTKPFTANSLLDAPLSSDLSVYARFVDPETVFGTGIELDSFERVNNNTYKTKVANATESLDLSDYVKVNSRSTWIVSSDISSNNVINSKVVTLRVGDNTYYVLVTAADRSSKLYTLIIRRRPIHDILFDTAGGTAVETQYVEEDDLATEPTTSRTGYTFVSWDYDFSKPVTVDTKVTASWTPNDYEIHYDPAGGELENRTTYVTYDLNYTLLTPTKRGYNFVGWFNGDEQVSDGVYKTDGDLSLVAKWEPIEYTITYDLDGGEVEDDNPVTYTVESENIILNNPTKLGYEFVGWTGTDVEEPSTGVIILGNSVGNRTFVAHWSFNGYAINYHLNDGTNSPDNPEGFTIASPNIYLANPTRTGYIFAGWYKTESFVTGTKITTIESGSFGDIDIYAKWTPVTYHVKFNSNGGQGQMNNELFIYDESQKLDQNKYTRVGYDFLGWSDKQDDTEARYLDKESVINLGNTQGQITELFAIWKPITAVVSFDNGIGEDGTSKVDVTFDDEMPEVEELNVPYGYSFDGYFDEDGKQYYDSNYNSVASWDKTEDTTLYAHFTAISANVTFDKQGGTGGSDNVDVSYNEEMPEATAPTRVGYEFQGYFYQENGLSTQYYDSNMNSVCNWDREYNATLYAYWVAKDHEVLFSTASDEYTQAKVVATFDAAMPVIDTTPTKSGYVFLGYFDESGVKYYDSDLSSAHVWDKDLDSTLYAHWTPIEYEVKFDGNNATSGEMDNQSFVYDVAQDLSENTYLRTGYSFVGWNTKADGTGQSYVDKESVLKMTPSQGNVVTLFAQWNPVSYTITYDLNGGINNANNPDTYTILDSITLNNPVREGYSFAGWSNNGKIDAGTTGNLSFVASWTANSYTVTFDKQGGTGGSNGVLATYDAALPQASAPSKVGYTFLGYFDINGIQYYDGDMNGLLIWDKAADTTLYARYVANTYNIAFHYNGGSGTQPDVVATFDQDMPLITVIPTRTGYIFAGYYSGVDANATKYYNADLSSARTWDIPSDSVLYAHWTPVNYQIKFDGNGATSGSMNNQMMTYGESANLTANTFAKTGYIFAGWNTKADGTGTHYDDGASVINLSSVNNAVVTLYVQWTPLVYSVHFDGNGATSGSMNNQVFAYDIAQNLYANNYVRTGYSFAGWNTAVDGSGQSFANEAEALMLTTTPNAVVTLYAQWTPVAYSITYELSGGTNNQNNPSTYTIEDTIVLEDPTRVGYTFDHWSDNGVITLGTFGDLVFTAYWTANSYTVTLDNQGGMGGDSSVTATFDSELQLVNTPYIFGYNFVGYFDSNNIQYCDSNLLATRTWDKASNATLYAHYSPVTCTVSFSLQGGSGDQSSVTATFDQDMPQITVTPTMEGYIFDGYYDLYGNQYYNADLSSAHTWDKITNTTLYAYWIAISYQVKFNGNGATSGSMDNQIFTYDIGQYLAANSYVKTGYLFAGWNTKADGTGQSFADESYVCMLTSTPNAVYNLYAQWDAITYSVSFDSNGATSGYMYNQYFTYDASQSLNTINYLRTGYEFVGWNTRQDGNGASYTNGESVSNLSSTHNSCVVLYAQWNALTYNVVLNASGKSTVYFNLNGGSGYIEPQVIDGTTTLIYPAIPSRDSYLFAGWYTESTCENLYDFRSELNGDVTLYAKWVLYDYGCTRVTIGVTNNIYIYGGTAIQYYAFTALRTGTITVNVGKSAYIGINTTTATPSSRSYGSASYYVTAGRTYYIWLQSYYKYTSSTYTGSTTLSFTGATLPYDGGSCNTRTVNLTYDSDFILPTFASKQGYTFVGWCDENNVLYTDENGQSIRTWDKASSAILYPKWVAYTVTANKNIDDAGTVSDYSNTNVTAGTSVTLTASTNVGYTWVGWFNGDELLTDSLTYQFEMTRNSVVYTAKWTVNQYSITFVSNGGSAVATITQDYNSVVVAPANPTLEEKSFAGWFDSTLTTQYVFSRIEAQDITLYAKWIDYEVNLTCDQVTELSINDLVNADSFNAVAIDTDGNPVEVQVSIIGGTKAIGESITVRLVAIGLYDIYATQTIANIKIYGTPTITYNTEKDYINMSDTLTPSLFDASATDTFGGNVTVNISVKEGTFNGGDVVTIVLSATDITGNNKTIEIANVKVYGTPTIERDTSVVDIKDSDTIGNALFNVTAADSFGVALAVTTERYSGTFVAGNTITIRCSTVDSKGNSKYITFTVRVFGTPSISDASTKDFKVSDEISLDSLGIVARDSFNTVLDNVTLEIASGTQVGGVTMSFLVTATDHLGNVNTRTIAGIRVFDTPTITFDTEKTSMNVTDTVNSALFTATAKDSFNGALSVTVTLYDGTFAGGNTVRFLLSTTDALGNSYQVITQSIKVYSSDDITLTYVVSASNIKLTSNGEEFKAQAINSFGEACVTSIEVAYGYTLAGGNVVSLYIVATDVMGNQTRSELISNIKVYDTPTLSYTRDYDYIQNGDSPYSLFVVLDSFGNELLFDVEIVSGSLLVNDTITYRITAKDKVKNELVQEYTLFVLDTNESILELYRNGNFVDYIRVYNGDDYALPYFNGYDVVWYLGNTAITDNRGSSLSAWDQESNGYVINTYPTTITYTITYNLDGGVNNANNVSSYNIESDDVILYYPTRTGYTFIGWTGTDVDELTMSPVITTGHYGNRSFVAHWSANDYLITFDANNGEVDISSKTVTFDDEYTVPTPSRVGYTFVGWYYNYTKYSGGTWQVANDVTLIASWSANTNTAYVVNHYQQNIENDDYTLYYTQNLTGTSDASITPSVRSYTGFTSPSAQTTTVLPDGSRVINYYYTRNYYTITVVGNGGTNNSIIQKYQSELDTTGWTVRAGHTFGSFYYDLLFTNQFTYSTMPAADSTVYAYWSDEDKPSDFTYSTSNSQVTISQYIGYKTQVSIPERINGYPVTTISGSAFLNKSSITSIVVPNSVTSIGAGAFRGCNSLVDVTLPFVGASRNTSYGYDGVFGYIFGWSSSTNTSSHSSRDYTYVNTMYGTKPDGTVWQYSCRNYSDPNYSGSNSYCYQSYYYQIPTTIRNVTITNATTIYVAAFMNCNFITNITLNSGVTDIRDYAFQNCSNLESINGNNIVNLPSTITSVGNYAFKSCTSITRLTVGTSISTIGSNAFAGCSSLATVSFSTGLTTISDNAFLNCSSLATVSFSTGLTTIGAYAFSNCPIATLSIPSTVTSIGNYAFAGNTAITSLSIPGNVKTIGMYAFSGLTNVTSLTINSGVESIGGHAFQNLAITNLVVPNSVTSIGAGAFKDCNSLVDVTLPFVGASRNTSYGYDGVFGYIFGWSSSTNTSSHSSRDYTYVNTMYGTKPDGTVWQYSCRNYSDPNYSGSNSYCYQSYYYQIPTTIRNVTITNATTIYVAAFMNCNFITNITLNSGVTDIRDYAFYGCGSNLTLTIPSAATIGNNAIPATVTVIKF